MTVDVAKLVLSPSTDDCRLLITLGVQLCIQRDRRLSVHAASRGSVGVSSDICTDKVWTAYRRGRSSWAAVRSTVCRHT